MENAVVGDPARHYFQAVKITVEIDAQDMRDVIRFSGEKRRGAALAKFLASSLQLSRRREVADKFLSGEWGTEGMSGAEKKADWAAAS